MPECTQCGGLALPHKVAAPASAVHCPGPRWCCLALRILGGTVRTEMTVLPGGHVVVALSGEIDIVTAAAAREVLAEAVRQAVTGITVALGEVTFIDAAGLGVLAGAGGCARHLPDGLRLAAVPARVLLLLRLTGLDRHLPAVPAPPASWPQREHTAPLPAVTGSPAATS